MSNKRDFEQVAPAEPPSPGAEASNESGPFKRQKRGFNDHSNGKARHRPSEGSSQWAKKRVRNIERLLNRNQDLPANVRNDLERELAAHKTSVGDKAFQKKRSAMISKYHMVRFFERKRAMRISKQLRKKLQQGEPVDERREELERHLHIAEVDEAYTQHYPHAETYVSLYKTEVSKDVDDEEDHDAKTKALLEAERPPMWLTIEAALEGGPSALRAVRERRTPDNSKPAGSRPERKKQQQQSKGQSAEAKVKTKATEKAAPKQSAKEATVATSAEKKQKLGKDGKPVVMNRRERRRLMREAAPAKDDEEDSDGGGFFEES